MTRGLLLIAALLLFSACSSTDLLADDEPLPKDEYLEHLQEQRIRGIEPVRVMIDFLDALRETFDAYDRQRIDNALKPQAEALDDLHSDAQSVIPPEDLADLHERWVDAIGLLASAVNDIVGALQRLDFEDLTDAEHRLYDAIDEIVDIDDEIDALERAEQG
jgi:hypothetical protein